MCKSRRWIGILLVLMLLPVSALASEIYYGTVVCDAPVTVSAPFGGVLEDLSIRKGTLIHKGDIICSIETRKVFSPVDGTVSAVFGDSGDSVEEVQARRGGIVYIIPSGSYTAVASTKDATRYAESYISIGQTVWLQKGNRRAPSGSGIVTSICTEGEKAGEYTVEIQDGYFSLDEKVNIHSEENMDKTTLLGQGTVEQTPSVIVNGEGSILRMHVKSGSVVSRGSLLFETVTGRLDEFRQVDNQIMARTDGIVASIEAGNGSSVDQNTPLITLYPLDHMRVCISVPETDLPLFPLGQVVNLAFSTQETRTGTVEAIDYLADEGENASVGFAKYKVYIAFEQKEDIRQGMFVTVDLPVPKEEKE